MPVQFSDVCNVAPLSHNSTAPFENSRIPSALCMRKTEIRGKKANENTFLLADCGDLCEILRLLRILHHGGGRRRNGFCLRTQHGRRLFRPAMGWTLCCERRMPVRRADGGRLETRGTLPLPLSAWAWRDQGSARGGGRRGGRGTLWLTTLELLTI